MPPFNPKYIRIVAITLALFLVAQTISVLKSLNAIGVAPSAQNTITVSGTGDAFAVPDIATFSFGADATAKTVADAQSKVTDVVNAALAKVKAAGVADADIQTTDYSANPKYDYSQTVCPAIATAGGAPYVCPPSKEVLTGYEVNETITVKVRKVDTAGAILSDIGGTGVTNVSGLSFTVDNPDVVQAQARTKAIADAKSKAEELAKELGVSLVRIVNFNENGGGTPYPIYMSANAMAAPTASSAPAPIQTGQNKVTSDVSVTYEIR